MVSSMLMEFTFFSWQCFQLPAAFDTVLAEQQLNIGSPGFPKPWEFVRITMPSMHWLLQAVME